jgi:hypothetical protein
MCGLFCFNDLKTKSAPETLRLPELIEIRRSEEEITSSLRPSS